jgi:hypothetical protein
MVGAGVSLGWQKRQVVPAPSLIWAKGWSGLTGSVMGNFSSALTERPGSTSWPISSSDCPSPSGTTDMITSPLKMKMRGLRAVGARCRLIVLSAA